MLLVAAAILLLLAGGGGAAVYFMGLWPAEGEGGAHTAEAGSEPSPPVLQKVSFVDLPDLLVNLRSSDRRPRFLKLRLALEVRDEQAGETVRSLTPRVMDSFQLYLRSLDERELDGPRGLQMLKDEMLMRINHALAPAQVADVLVKEMLVQ
ncbi:flagellar basal body-associated FliL family protein [Geminicoccaceae bacterium 1502E]|nr:flagellar basal body-associated FliL family protein [Geminicoccaceae bacterium 1502E]